MNLDWFGIELQIYSVKAYAISTCSLGYTWRIISAHVAYKKNVQKQF